MAKLRVGIVGCGAVTARSHLPALSQLENIQLTALADPNVERAGELAQRFNVPNAVSQYHDLLNDVDALVLALPHHLHAIIGEDVLRSGKHVLMEKPLAMTLVECDRLVEISGQNGATLTVAQVRRFMTAYKMVKEWLTTGILGELKGFEVEEGGVYNWPVASNFFFHPKMAGGGVLMDSGAHVLDALLWWLGDLNVVNYSDDSAGGIEADCSLGLETVSGINGTVILSRIRQLKNKCVFYGSRANLEIGMFNNEVTLMLHDASGRLVGKFCDSDIGMKQTTVDLFKEQAREWINLINRKPVTITTAKEARRYMRVIQEAYSLRRSICEPWDNFPDENLTYETNGRIN